MAGIERLLIDRVLGGRYRIEEVIGRGGMGAVYRALDERLGRRVALKVITVTDTGDPAAQKRLRDRFTREARSAAALPHHPNIVPVYDYGRDEELGLDYLVMELLRGSDLATRLARSGPPPLAASLKILLEAARGLAVGHQQGLVHRDVKPGNIFLTQTHDNEVQVRVVDFGIAKLADDEDTLAQLTQDGRVPHSPAYASPEQLRGLGNLTPAADVFSLGAVGYQLLAGERPFTEADRNRMSLGMGVDPPPLRQRNPAVPGNVEAVIHRALSYDPEARYPDAGTMAAELETAVRSIAQQPLDPYLGGSTIVTATEVEDHTAVAPEEDDHTRLAEPEDDHTLLAPPPAPTVAAPGPGRLGPPPGDREAARRPIPPRRPPEPKRGVGGMLVWGLVLAVLVLAAVWGVTSLQDSPPRFVDVEPGDTAAPLEDTLPTVDPIEADALAVNRDGITAFEAGRLQEALRHFERAVQLSPTTWEYRRNFGYTFFRVGQLAEAERELREAIRIDPSRAEAYVNLGDVQLAAGDTTAAVQNFEAALEREPNPAIRDRLRRIETARSQVPLLGDPVPPRDEPTPADTLSAPTLPGV